MAASTATNNSDRDESSATEPQTPHDEGMSPDSAAPANPTNPKRKRIVNRGLLAAAVTFVVLIGAAYFHIRVYPEYWTPKTPTWILLQIADKPTNHAAGELMHRMTAGKLDAAQIQSLMDLYIERIDVEVRSPYPSNLEQDAYVTLGCPLSKKNWATTVEEITMIVDKDAENAIKPTSNIWNQKLLKYDSPIEVPKLKDGTHLLAFSGVATIRPITDGKAGDIVCRHPFAIEKTVEIAGDLSRYSAAIGSDEHIEWMENGLAATVSYCKHHERYKLVIYERKMPVPIAASVWVRPDSQEDDFLDRDDDDDYRLVGHLTSRCWKGIIFMYSHEFPLDEILKDRVRGRMSVRLVPDPQTAIFDQLEEYFDGTIEWRRLTFNPRHTESVAPQYARNPWRVVRPSAHTKHSDTTGA